MPKLLNAMSGFSRFAWPVGGYPTRISAGVVLCSLLLISSLVGCGPRSDRLPISGEVTLDGTPLDSGSIRFTSQGSEQLLTAGSLIQNGKFQISREKGLLPGLYHLEIYSPDVSAPPVMVRERPGGPGIPVAPERIPPEYNVESQQTIEVTASGKNHFVFEIVSK